MLFFTTSIWPRKYPAVVTPTAHSRAPMKLNTTNVR